MQDNKEPYRAGGLYARTLSLAALAFGLLALFSSYLVWRHFHVEVPVRDMAWLLPLLDKAVSDGLLSTGPGDWFSLHSIAHRVAVIRAFAYLDYALFMGRNWVLYAGTAASIFLTLYVYCRAAIPALGRQRGAQFFVPGLTLVFLCSPMQYWNLVTPLCATWYYNMAFSALGAWILVRHAGELRGRHLAAIMLLAAAAAYSNFSGVIFCLFLPVVAFLLGSAYWQYLAGAALVFSGLYVLGIEGSGESFGGSSEFDAALAEMAREKPELFTEHGWFYRALETVRPMPGNVATHLGMPVSRISPALAATGVFVSVLAIAYLWLQLVIARFSARRASGHDAAVVFFLVMATLQLGICCSIWLGRIGLSDPTSPRYQSITIVYWLSVILLLLCAARQRRKAQVELLMSLALVGAVLLNVLTTLRPVGNLPFMYHQVQQEKVLRQLGVENPAPLINAAQASWRDVLLRHQDFVAGYTLPPVSHHSIPAATGTTNQSCAAIQLIARNSGAAGVQRATMQLRAPILRRSTRVYLTGENGQAGLFYPSPPPNLWPHALIKKPTRWQGFFLDQHEAETLTVVFDRDGVIDSCTAAVTHRST